jgi:hypothetical protein
VKHNALVPWLIALLVFGPFGLAMLTYYSPWGRDWLPQLPGERELLTSPVTLPAEWLPGAGGERRWLLIYARMTRCEQRCAEMLDRLARVRQALNRDQDRVGRALWHTGDAEVPGDPELAVRRLDEAPGSGVAAALGVERIGDGRVYVADPRGSVILSYPPDVDQKELLRDLKRLVTGAGTG